MPAVKQLILFEGPTSGVEDRRLFTFSASMGVPAKIMPFLSDAVRRVRDEFQPGTCCLAMSAEALDSFRKESLQDDGPRELFDGHFPAVLIFGWTGSKEQQDAAAMLTTGAVVGVKPNCAAEKIALPSEGASLSGQFAGQEFLWERSNSLAAFDLRNGTPDVSVILTANERPIFLRAMIGSCHVFLSTTPMPDTDIPLSSDQGIEDHYISLIPQLIFFRHCFQQGCWHGVEKTGRLIIDDPLLSERYGYLDYNALLRSMDYHLYGTSIAFIPWNYWRTSRNNVSRFLTERSQLTICIHGCDHTNREFDTQSDTLLDRKAGLGMRRMESQRRRTGANFEDVMVFPQGRFSSTAISALRANNYLAAVNTTCFPTDSGPEDLTVADFLWPAVTRYNGFPIFHRRYPRRLFDFAFDLFLGKPALIVEHHEYFRNGCLAIEEFVAGLHKLEPALSWPTLSAQLARSCLRRNLPDASVEVRFFTRRFQLLADKRDTGGFLLSKHEPDPTTIESVLVDGKAAPFWFDQEYLQLEVHAEPGLPRNIEIIDRAHLHHQPRFGVAYNTRVMIRRGLSEFRDNTLARHDGLLRVAKGLAKTLKATGDA
jgi:hypothetical protein